MNELEDFLDVIESNHNKLIITNEKIESNIFDVELDLLNCEFDSAGNVQINTDNLAYITLDISILERLIELTIESEIIL